MQRRIAVQNEQLLRNGIDSIVEYRLKATGGEMLTITD